jgi:predicted small lipoprotein YifL
MKTVKAILLIMITTAVIGACGLRGPLYLQDEAPATAPAVEQDSTPDKDGVEEKDKDKEKDKGTDPS